MCLVSDESTRVALQPIRGVDGSDYINASFINVSTGRMSHFSRHQSHHGHQSLKVTIDTKVSKSP